MVDMKFILSLFVILVMNNALAIPGVEDYEEAKQYYVLLKQLNQLKKQVSQEKDMINQGKREIKDAEGHYGYGNLGKLDLGSDDPSTWTKALRDLSGGNSARYQELLKKYKENHYILSDKEYSKGASKSLVKSYRNQINVNQASAAISENSYDSAGQYQKQLNTLNTKIDSTPNTKAAIDLNSRLIAELSSISIDQLRMQAVMNNQVASDTADKIEAKSREARFVQLPKEK